MSEHQWDFCSMCGVMVRCGTCGNNCCSGGHGELPDGTACPDCAAAYEMQQLGFANGTAPPPESFLQGSPAAVENALRALRLGGVEPVEFDEIALLLDFGGQYTTPDTP